MYSAAAAGGRRLAPAPAVWLNSGGPRSRQRREMIDTSLLGDARKWTCWPNRLRIGLVFPPGADPLRLIRDLCTEAGFSSPEQLRRACVLPARPLTARPARDANGLVDVVRASRDRVLEQAVLLGLCTAVLYEPGRPMLWTHTSLTRRLDLFAPGDFYADD